MAGLCQLPCRMTQEAHPWLIEVRWQGRRLACGLLRQCHATGQAGASGQAGVCGSTWLQWSGASWKSWGFQSHRR